MKVQYPLVSIILNCYNGQRFLNPCVKSVINQSYKNWELIFWNNNSTDNSLKLIKKFHDKRIKIFNSKSFNSLYHSRNLALNKCKGKYICFIDIDDLWLKDKLLSQMKVISKNTSIKIIYTNYYVKFENKKKKYVKFSKKLKSGFITKDLLRNYDVAILTTLLDKKIFDYRKFDKSYNIIGDFDYFINLSLKYKFYVIQKPLAILRIHNDNTSSKQLDAYIKELSGWLKQKSDKKKFSNFDLIYIQVLLIKLKIKFYLKTFFNIKLGV